MRARATREACAWEWSRESQWLEEKRPICTRYVQGRIEGGWRMSNELLWRGQCGRARAWARGEGCGDGDGAVDASVL